MKKVKHLALERVKVEIDAHNEADSRTFHEGLSIIELFKRLHNYIKLGQNELEKVQLAKVVHRTSR